MKVFISWSGDTSEKIAEKLKEFIRYVIQTANGFYSSEDIEKGTNWQEELNEALSQCQYGVVCLTKDNLKSEWIHYEAGAIASTKGNRLSSIMFGVDPSDLSGALKLRQNTRFERDDMFKLIKSINKNSEIPTGEDVLEDTFDWKWDNFEWEVKRILDGQSEEESLKSALNYMNKKTLDFEDIYAQKVNKNLPRYKLWLIDTGPRPSGLIHNLCKDYPDNSRSYFEKDIEYLPTLIYASNNYAFVKDKKREFENLGAKLEIQ